MTMAGATSISTAKLTETLEQYDDITSWINDALNANETIDDLSTPSNADLTKLDQYITQLLTTLDIACEDTSAQLERIIDDVSRGIPRLAYDLHFMKDGALSLQSSLVEVLKKSKDAVPAETSAALDNLHHLDTVKGRMEAARDVLQEAESWSTLEMEVTSLIGERNYIKAAERLSEASKSMVVFQNTPEYDPRRALMVNLQNQLEAALSSALVAAINSQDVAACKDYFSIFSTIQRESEFRNYYNAARRTSVVTMWQSANFSDCDTRDGESSGPRQSFADFLPKFYATFLALLNAERGPISSIFPDPPATVSRFISSTMATLQPTFSQRLSSYANHYGESCLSHLVTVQRSTEEFATGVWKMMEKLQDSEPSRPKPVTPSERPSGHRRRSSRMSISWRPGQPKPTSLLLGGVQGLDNLEWDQELFQPFLDLQVDYSSLERRFLDQALLDIITNDPRDNVSDLDRARLFRERAVDIVGIAEGSMVRCKAFTHGYGSVGLIQALDGFFASFVDSWTAELASQPSSSQSYSFSTSELELADLDYSAKDWSEIQLMLHMLGSARGVSERITTFETKLRSYLSQTAAHFRLAQMDPLNITTAATKGQTQLLEQSSLNSADLFSLLSSVEEIQSQNTPLTALHSATFRQTQQVQQAAPESILVQTRQSLSGFAQGCQVSMQKTILSPLRNHLSSYASASIWSSREDPQSALAADLHIPTFSLSPSETVQRVAEGLLNLPRLFDIYADDDALGFSLQTLPHVDPEMLKPSEQHLDVSSQGVGGHHRRASVVFKPAPVDPELVSSAWLLSLGHTLLSYLTTNVLPSISTLTSVGAAQLTSDLEYLSNIVRALNVENETLEQWRGAVASDDEELKKEAQQSSADSIVLRMAKIRGLY
ncbi:hypothetical protein FA15DRAFT_759046 [Coprinopsis marcescibilis]|uniref:Conserved oligomeric Golgi complex subunit 7 n=1 Tax=Coprinopsis marcescibilis TaxID=230819 RepID=A0A5C3KLV5_COPMA|nr:hypothetical protein FA15DRAFT_759046 [Coprinopsis marcescibilis]